MRITKTAETPSSVTLKIDGRIVGEWGPFFIETIRECSSTANTIVLDFSDVSFIDDATAEALRALTVQDLEIINCSTFIDALLKR